MLGKKNIIKLAGVVLISSSLLPFQAEAASKNEGSTTKATVGFNVKELEWPLISTNGTKDIENPNPSSETSGNVKFVYVTDFDFGTHNYSGLSSTYYAKPQKFKVKQSDGKVTEETGPLGLSIGQLPDGPHWHIYVQREPFVTEDKRELTRAKLFINDAHSIEAGINWEQGIYAQDNHFEVNTEAGYFAKSDNYDKKQALMVFAFGNYKEGEEYQGVSLEVPGGTKINDGDKYTSAIIWTIAVDGV